MIYASRSEQGVREKNEDTVYTPNRGEISLVVVADGMGGHNAGSTASSMAVKVITDTLKKGGATSPDKLILGAVERANVQVYEYAAANKSCRGMGTTMVLALLFKSRYIAANIGDSRLYCMRMGKLTQITRDHSYVGELVASGQITKEQAMTHPRRNIITRALGTRKTEKADIFECEWSAGDMLLLCTDGIHGVLTDDEIEAILNVPDNEWSICDMLVDEALKKGSDDNISAVLVRNSEVR